MLAVINGVNLGAHLYDGELVRVGEGALEAPGAALEGGPADAPRAAVGDLRPAG